MKKMLMIAVISLSGFSTLAATVEGDQAKQLFDKLREMQIQNDMTVFETGTQSSSGFINDVLMQGNALKITVVCTHSFNLIGEEFYQCQTP